MRIYEFAKQYNVTSKELIDFLKKEGFAVGNHMSVLNEEEIIVLHKKYDKNYQLSPKEIENVPKQMINNKDTSAHLKNEKIDISSAKALQSSPSKNTLILNPMSVMEFAHKIHKPVSEIILHLLKMGIATTKNQIIPEEIIVKIADHFGIEIIKNTNKKFLKEEVADSKSSNESEIDMIQNRLPIVVVLGHVDHGKTTLLDFIRKTRVASKEKGGITQHIGAYQATTKQGDIVFIDTPGHEAFSKIRQRGIKVADIAIIVVAADDGVMPQTVEAIKQAIAMNVTIIVAINKMDKADNNRLDIVKRQLTQYGLVAEDWGGDIVCVPISAKLGTGVDQLLDMVILQSQMMELKTNAIVSGRGYILESKIERGKGIVATLISQHGTINKGDYFSCGNTSGHIISLVDSYGISRKAVGPSVPVQINGFDSLPEVGEFFKVISREEYNKFKKRKQENLSITISKNTVQNNAINLLIKTDTDSSKEALLESIENISKKSEKGLNIIYAGVGNISESDVELAFNTNSQIISLHTKTPSQVISLASQRKISILNFDIIYKLLEYLQERVKVEKVVPLVLKKIGQATVLRIFDIKGIGSIAGCIVNEGKFNKDGETIILRSGRKVGKGSIKSLQREKRSVKEVNTGFECGFMIDGFSEWQLGDTVECYALEKESKK